MNRTLSKGARLGTAIFTAALAAGMLTAVAAEETGADGTGGIGSQSSMTKSVLKDENTYAPNTTLNFTLTQGTGKPASGGQPAIYDGIPGGVTLDSGDFVFAPQDSDIGKAKVSSSNGITVHLEKFSKPGIYRYSVQETIPGTPYDGLSYNTEPKTLDVYISADREGCLNYTLIWTDADGCKGTGEFENTYETGCFTVEKTVTGNQGDRNKTFSFTLKVDGAEGEQYKVLLPGGGTGTMVSGEEFTVTLKDSQTVKVYGLSANDVYTVTEDDYSSDGYSTTVSVNGGEAEETRTTTGSVPKGGESCIEFTNCKEVTPPTGLLMDTAPYAAMIVLAGLFAIFLRRRRREE